MNAPGYQTIEARMVETARRCGGNLGTVAELMILCASSPNRALAVGRALRATMPAGRRPIIDTTARDPE